MVGMVVGVVVGMVGMALVAWWCGMVAWWHGGMVVWSCLVWWHGGVVGVFAWEMWGLGLQQRAR